MRTELYSFFAPITEDENVMIDQRSLGSEQLSGVCCLVSTVSFVDNLPLMIYNQNSQPIIIMEQANERKHRGDFPHTISFNGQTFHYIDARFLEGIQIGCTILGYDNLITIAGDVIGSESEDDDDSGDDSGDEELPSLVG